MVNMFDLPNELIEDIINLVYHTNLEDFARTCKFTMALSQSALKEKYSNISSLKLDDPNLATLTENVWLHPWISQFIENLHTEGWENRLQEVRLPAEIMLQTRLEELLRSKLKAEIVEYRKAYPSRPNFDRLDGAVLASLLLNLPMLKTLYMVSIHRRMPSLTQRRSEHLLICKNDADSGFHPRYPKPLRETPRQPS